jgi:hypothetical protein
MIALPARALGISATTTLIVLTPLVAFLCALALFWLIVSVTGNDGLAAVGVLVVLCLGALAAGEGTIAGLTSANTHFDYFPLLRRYQPAASFPLFATFCVLTWRSLTHAKGRVVTSAVLAGTVFGLLVFSYFYLWTAAAAWLATLGMIWLVARPGDRSTVIRFLAVIAAAAGVALVPYMILLSHRATTTENVQALVLSRRPDLFSVSEIIGGVILLVLVWGVRRGSIEQSDRRVIFAASFALLPLVVLNQQVITGRVMQPIHYKGFITNYAVLIAFVLIAGIGWRRVSGERWKVSKRTLVWVAVAALEWGSIEGYRAARRSAGANYKAAEEMPVYSHLSEQITANPSDRSPLVLFSDLRMADGAPAAMPLPVLWAPHMLVYAGITNAESKERLYQHLYYTGVSARQLDDYFHGRTMYYGCAVGLFGFDRLIDGLNPNAKPISEKEIQDVLISYTEYASRFNHERAANPTLSYVVAPIGEEPDWSNLDRWYQRDQGEKIGKFRLYRVKLRPQTGEEFSPLAPLVVDTEAPKGGLRLL